MYYSNDRKSASGLDPIEPDNLRAQHGAQSDQRHVSVPAPGEDAQAGVKAVEATQQLWGTKRSAHWWTLYLSIALVAYVASLDGNTSYVYLNSAASAYSKLGLYSTISIVQQMIIAVAKPPIAKISDVFGRPAAYLTSVLFYVLGYIIMAASHNLNTLAGGVVLYAIGNTGVQILQQILVADTTTAKWRGLTIGLINTPYIINFGVAPKVASGILASGGWRWGYGMMCILIPATTGPLIIVLFLAERRAKRANLLPASPYVGNKPFQMVVDLARELDLFGVLLLTAGWLLLLLPLTLVKDTPNAWKAGHIIAMIVVGGVCLIAFGIWELFPSRPIMPYQCFKNRAVMAACVIGFFDFASFYISWNYLYSFVTVSRGWSVSDATYFSSTQSVTSTVFGTLVGGLMAWTRHYKYFLVGGVVVRLLGVGLMIRFRTPTDPTVALVWCQLLQGIGGGLISITIQTSAQVCVRHGDVAVVTALVLLLTEIGGAVGSAIAGAMYTQILPNKLEQYLPQLTPAQRGQIYAGLDNVANYPIGDPVREGIAAAWGDTMRRLTIAATAILTPALIVAFFTYDRRLSDAQNVVEEDDDSSTGAEKEEAVVAHDGFRAA